MPKNQPDVKLEQDPSTAPGVRADSPPAADVSSAPSAEAPQERPHEDAIPYSRFKEEIDKNNRLREELEALKNQYVEEPPEKFDWKLFPDQNQQPVAPPAATSQPQQPFSPEEIEARIREDLYEKPFQTLYPIMMEAAKQVIRDQKQKESRVRSIPDFRNYESTYYSVPEELVLQAQTDPELVRYLLAKHKETLSKPKRTMAIDNPATPPSSSGNGPSRPANTMEDLAEKYRREGEARMIEKLRSQQGVTAEGAASIPQTDVDEPELDDQGVMLMSKLGISQGQLKNVAKRLDNFVKGK